VFLFLARVVDEELLPALSSLTSQQANPTERTIWLCKQFFGTMSTQEDAVLTYQASNMALAIHSNVSYLFEPESRSCAGGHILMGGKEEIPINNGAVLNILQIIWAVMSSAVEAELGALFINAKIAVSMRQTQIELGHPQPHTPMQTNNATAHVLLTNNILPKAPKAMDMCFHWLRCCDALSQFHYYLQPGMQNLADYFTKHHPATHHKSVHPTVLTTVNDPEYRKLFVTQDASPPQINVKSGRKNKEKTTKIQNTNKNVSYHNFFCQTLSQTTKFRNMITAKSA
jgi:hypothetical protein